MLITLRPGDMVGDYLLEGVIGTGGMGAVYRALQPIIGRRVAIKVLKPSWSGRADTVARFVREARTIHRIKHRGVPDVFTFGTLPNGLHYYVMELLEGEDLRARLVRMGSLPPAMMVRVVAGIASILDAAHDAGIVHRDLKPENVFLTFDPKTPEEFEVKLLDFGIAKLASTGHTPDGDGFITSSHAILGTPVYMSPEQCLGQSVDARSDIYSLGVLAFEMLAGKPPFSAKGKEIFERKLSGEIPRVSDARAELAPFDRAVGSALGREPESRPSTASTLADDLAASIDRSIMRANGIGRRLIGLAAVSALILTGVAYAVVRGGPAPRLVVREVVPAVKTAPPIAAAIAPPIAPVIVPEALAPPATPVAPPPVAPSPPRRAKGPTKKRSAKPIAPPQQLEPPPPPPSDVVPDMPVRF